MWTASAGCESRAAPRRLNNSRSMPTCAPYPVAASDHDTLDLVEAELFLPAVIKLRRAGVDVIYRCSGIFEFTAVFQICSDSGGTDAVVPDRRFDAGGGGTPHVWATTPDRKVRCSPIHQQ